MNMSHHNALTAALLAANDAATTSTTKYKDVNRKISRATLHLFTSIFICSCVLTLYQFRRLSNLSTQFTDDDFTNDVPSITVRYDRNTKMEWSLPTKGSGISSEEFMASLQKRQLKSAADATSPQRRLTTPIFVLNLPKSGTETSRDYFTCGGYESSHTYVSQRRIGTCLFDNWSKSQALRRNEAHDLTATKDYTDEQIDPLQGCNSITKKYYIPPTDPRYGKNVTVQVFSDIGTPNPTCYYPTIHNGGLEYLHSYYPNATWVVFVRNGDDWYDSMKRWGNGSLLKQWKNRCDFPGGTNSITSEQDWINFYARHTEKIRQFALEHSSLNYIEVELESAHTTLEKYTGIESKCWRHCLPGRTDDEKCVQIGEKHVEKKLMKQKMAKSIKAASANTKIEWDKSPPLPWSLPKVPENQKNAFEFMSELAKLKHKHGIILPWELDEGVHGLKLPTPIFILNLPKSGTQTLTEFFKCGQIESSHTYVRQIRTGDCLRDNYLADTSVGFNNYSAKKPEHSYNISSGVDPLSGCDEVTKKYHIPRTHPDFGKNVSVLTYSDIGTPYPGRCFYSSINDGGLEHLYKYYPNSTIMYLTRDVNSWYASATKWNEGRILKSWKARCGFHGGLNTGSKEDWVNFYHAHTEKIRQFAKEHLTMTYVEMELEDASLIDYYTGIHANCFKHCLPGKKANETCKPLGYNFSEYNSIKNNHTELIVKSEERETKVISKKKVVVDNSPPLPWTLPKVQVPENRKNATEFMSELAELKRTHGISIPWERDAGAHGLKLPTPIFILNLPKSGTQTLTEFFKCGDLPSTHTFIGLTRTGDCLRDNYLAQVDPLKNCDTIEAKFHVPKSHPDFGKNVSVLTYSDIGTPHPGRCFYSSLNDGGLEHLYKYYPNSTIMLVTREANSWYTSMTKWNEGRLLAKWKARCGFHGSIGDGSQEDWVNFYHAHTEKIRNFALTHLTMTYIEMELEDASMIEHYTGVDLECFQHCLPGKKAGEMCRPLGSKSP